jgi:hypothetical protein
MTPAACQGTECLRVFAYIPTRTVGTYAPPRPPQLLYWDTLGRQLRLFQALSDFLPERSREHPG